MTGGTQSQKIFCHKEELPRYFWKMGKRAKKL